MKKYQDLNIEKEIIPLFDFTLNNYSKDFLLQVFQNELQSIDAIHLRQNILTIFQDYKAVFSNYYYSKTEFIEVYNFLHELEFHEKFQKRNIHIFFDKSKKQRIYSRFKQFLLLFNRLEKFYFSKLRADSFPSSYHKDMLIIKNFFESLKLSKFEITISENKLKIKDLQQLSKLIVNILVRGDMDKFYTTFFLFETYLSISKGITKHKFNFPSVDENSLSFEELFDLTLTNPIKNSFIVDNNTFVLTGPNMSGKSTLLKSIGIAIYLSKLGLAIPANKANIPFFDYVTISINHNDNIHKGYSHFMNEIITLKEALIELKNRKKVFAIFDEFFSGTNTDDANQIISTTINGLSEISDSYFFLSTHLHHLYGIENKNLATYSMDCEVVNSFPLFKYKLVPGWSILKVGQILFEIEGLNHILKSL